MRSGGGRQCRLTSLDSAPSASAAASRGSARRRPHRSTQSGGWQRFNGNNSGREQQPVPRGSQPVRINPSVVQSRTPSIHCSAPQHPQQRRIAAAEEAVVAWRRRPPVTIFCSAKLCQSGVFLLSSWPGEVSDFRRAFFAFWVARASACSVGFSRRLF